MWKATFDHLYDDWVRAPPQHTSASQSEILFPSQSEILLFERTSALHEAAKENRTSLVVSLVTDCRAAASRVDGDQMTLVHHAVRNKNEQLVRFLMRETCIDINRSDYYGCTALDVAVDKGLAGMFRLLVTEYEARITPRSVMITIDRCYTQIADFMRTACGIDFSDILVHDLVPIVRAARVWSGGDSSRMVRFLVEHGADVNPPGDDCPVSDAAHRCNTGLVEYLVEKGARAPPSFARVHSRDRTIARAVERGLRKRSPSLHDLLPPLLVPYIGEKALVGVVAEYAVWDCNDWLAAEE